MALQARIRKILQSGFFSVSYYEESRKSQRAQVLMWIQSIKVKAFEFRVACGSF